MLQVISITVAVVSCIIAAIACFTNIRRNQSADDKQSSSELTTVIVKLETINTNVTELKADMRNQHIDMQEQRERLIIVEQSTKSAHHRLDLQDQRIAKLEAFMQAQAN